MTSCNYIIYKVTQQTNLLYTLKCCKQREYENNAYQDNLFEDVPSGRNALIVIKCGVSLRTLYERILVDKFHLIGASYL